MQTELSGADGDLASSSLQHKIPYHLKKKNCSAFKLISQCRKPPHPTPPLLLEINKVNSTSCV